MLIYIDIHLPVLYNHIIAQFYCQRNAVRNIYLQEVSMEHERVMISSAEAAKLLGVSRPTFYELAATDGFPAMRVGRKYLVCLQGLRRWAEENCGRTFD